MPQYEINLEGNFTRRLDAANTSVNRFDASVGRGIKSMAGFAIAGAAIGRVLTGSVQKMADFEETASNLSAITGLMGEDLDFLKTKAIELGGATTKSSKDTLEAFKLIASAKPELLTNARALASVTREAIALSEASGLELPAAATHLTSALNQFNLSASQSGRVINVLAAGSKFAAAEIPDLAVSLGEFGGIAESLNISLEESAAAVETLSTKVKGARAGIQLRNVFLKLGSSADKFNPKVVGLSTALENLSEIQDDTTKLGKMFNTENVLAAQTLIKQRHRLVELTEAMTGTSTAYEQQSINTDNLNSDFKRLSSSWEKFVLNLNEGSGVISKVMRGATQGVTGLLDMVTKLNEGENLKLQGLKIQFDFEGKIEKARRDRGAIIAELAKKESITEEEAGKRILKKHQDRFAAQLVLIDELNKKREETPFDLKSNRQFKKEMARLEFARDAAKEYIDIFSNLGTSAAPVSQIEAVSKVSGLQKVEDQVTKITSAAPKTFNINIAKFVENFSVNSETVTEGAAETMDIFTKMWVKMLADVQVTGS